MRKIILIILTVSIFLSCSNKDFDTEKMIKHGLYLNDNLRYKEALMTFNECLKKEPHNIDALDGKAVSLIYLKRTRKAKKILLKAYEIDSENSDVCNDLGKLFSDRGEYSMAKHYFKKALQIDSTLRIPYSNLGVIAVLEEKYDSALTYHNKAIMLDTMFAGSYLNRAKMFEQKGDTTNALLDYNTAINLSTFLSIEYVSHLSRGYFCRDIGRYDIAILDFTALINIEPDNRRFYHLRGLSYSGNHEYNKALDDFKKAKSLGMPFMNDLIEECEYLIKTGV